MSGCRIREFGERGIILEALFGLLLCLTVSPIGLLYGFVMLFKIPEKTYRWLPFLVYSLGIIAYSCNPFAEDDLVRYFYRAQEYAGLPLSRVFYDATGINQYDVLTFVYSIWSWIVGQIGAVHLLPMVSVMTVYSIAFYITADMAHKMHGERYIPFIILFQLCLIPLHAVLANVRNVWAFSLIILAVYLDLVKGKRNPIILLLYVLPGFIHSSAFLLLILRLICKMGSKVYVPMFIGSLAFPQILDILYDYSSLFSALGTMGLFINLNILKLYWYIHDNGDSEWAQQVSNSFYQKINRAVMISFAVIVCILILLWIKKHIEGKYHPFLNYMFLLNVTTITFTWFTIGHFWRISAASFIGISVILLPILLNYNKKTPILIKLFRILLPVYILMGILLQWWPVKYTVIPSEWMIDAVTTNIFTIFIDILKGIL